MSEKPEVPETYPKFPEWGAIVRSFFATHPHEVAIPWADAALDEIARLKMIVRNRDKESEVLGNQWVQDQEAIRHKDEFIDVIVSRLGLLDSWVTDEYRKYQSKREEAKKRNEDIYG